MKLTRRGVWVSTAAFVIMAFLFVWFVIPPFACWMGGTC